MKYFFNIFIFYFFLLPIIYVVSFQKFDLIFIFIIILILSFYLGLNINLVNKVIDKKNGYALLKVNANFLYLFFILYFIDYSSQFETLIALFKGNYIEKGLEKAISRYEDDIRPTVISQFTTIFFFIYCFALGSFISNKNKLIEKIKFLTLWLILCLFETSTLSRASLLLGTSGVASVFLYNNRYKIPKISLIKIHVYFAFILLILLAIFSFSAYGRVSKNDNVLDIILEKLSGYTIAMYDALLIWSKTYNFTNIKFGLNTFTFIPKLLAFEFKGGYYELVETRYGDTNIYTFVRGIIEDFSLLSIFAFFIMGLQINWLNSKKNPKKISIILNLWVINLFLFPLISIFNFTVYFIGYMIFTLLVNFKKAT